MPPEWGSPLKIKLTDIAVRSIKPNLAARIEISDTERSGLRFRMSPKGNASWLYQKKIKGGTRRGFKLGSYPAMSLAQARSAALEIQIEAESGVDRVLTEEDAKARLAADGLKARSVSDVLELYVATYLQQELKAGQSREERTRQLRTYLAPYYSKFIGSLTRSDLQIIVDGKQAEGKVVMANRLRAALSAFTGWAYRRGHMPEDVGVSVQRAGKETPRERTPSLDEVKEIWAQTFKMGKLWGPYFRMCILTGQRSRKDILEMRWSWIDMDRCRYEIPRPKNGRPHIVHLSDPAMAELRRLKEQQVSAPCPFVFSTTGRTSATGVSKATARLDAYITSGRAETGLAEPFEPWVLHDLRRSQATALAEAGFDEGVVDRIQNHVATGSRASAVAAVYNKAQKLPERAAALDAWARMVTQDTSNVVTLRQA